MNTCPACGAELKGSGRVCHSCHRILSRYQAPPQPSPKPVRNSGGLRLRTPRTMAAPVGHTPVAAVALSGGGTAAQSANGYVDALAHIQARHRPRTIWKGAPPASRPLLLSIFIVLYDISLIICLILYTMATLALLATPMAPVALVSGAGVAVCLFTLTMMHALWRGKRWGQIGATIFVLILMALDIVQRAYVTGAVTQGLDLTLVLRVAFLVVLWCPATLAYVRWSTPRGI